MDVIAKPMTCTSCGAALSPKPGDAQVTCSYCQQTYELQRPREPIHPRAAPAAPAAMREAIPSVHARAPSAPAVSSVLVAAEKGIVKGVKFIAWLITMVVVVAVLGALGLVYLVAHAPAPAVGPATAPGPAATARTPSNPPGHEPRGAPITAGTQMAPGDAVWVSWNRQWYDAQVISGGAHGPVKVHYVGWSSSYDETVTRDRIRR